MVSKEALTSSITISTGVPSPPRHEDVNTVPLESEPTIEIRTCSELTRCAAPIKYFSSSSKLQALVDFDDQTIVFAIGQNDLLNCLVDRPGNEGGWSMYELRPSSDKVVAFDVFKHVDPVNEDQSGFFITAATAGTDGMTTIYHSWIAKGPDTDWNVLNWKKIANSDGQKSITSLMVGLAPWKTLKDSRHIIFAGSRAQGDMTATFYIVNPTDGIRNPWIPYAADTAEDTILNLQSATLGTAVNGGQGTDTQNGLFVLSQKVDRTDVLFYALDPTTLQKTNSMSTLRPEVGKVNYIYSSRNPWGYTDLALACEKGVCFLNYRDPTGHALVVENLPKTEFVQVVCSELVNQAQNATAITMFAVTRQGHLYFIEGERTWGDDWTLTFRASGFPIRQNVTQLSCQYNYKLDSSQLVYVSSGDDEVKQLLRAPTSTNWYSDVIRFAAPNSMESYNAFMTTISISSTDGSALTGFPVGISADPANVLANERSYALSAQTTPLRTNDRGQITLIAPAMDSLLAPSYTLSIVNSASDFSTTIHGGQRVSNILSSVRDSDDIFKAKTSTGVPVFSPADIDGRENDFQETAEFLKDFPAMFKAVDVNSDTSSQKLSEKEIEISHAAQNESVPTPASLGSLITNAIYDVTDFLGDAIEWLKEAAKTAFRAICKVVATGVKFILKVAGKIVSFVVKTVGPLLKVVGTFLEEKLGIDFEKLFQWLGLTFDVKKTKANQKVIKEGLHILLSLPGHFITANTSHIENMFETLEGKLEPFLGTSSTLNVDTVQDPHARLRNSPLGWLIDNPIINLIMKLDPISFILDAVSDVAGELAGDDFKMPKFGELAEKFGDTLSKLVSEELVIIIDLFEKIQESIREVAKDPAKVLVTLKDTFQYIGRALFKAVKKGIMGLWQKLSDLMDLVVKYIEEEWKIPYISELFSWYAEQEYTLLNVFTFVLARIMGLIVGEENVTDMLNLDGVDQALVSTAKGSKFLAFGQETSEATQPVKASLLQSSASHGLSKDAQDRIHNYEKRSRITTSVINVVRFGLVTIEALHAARKSGGSASKAITTVAVVGAGLSVAGSVAQICFHEAALAHSDEVREHLSNHIVSRKVGLYVGLFANCGALGFAGYHLHLAKEKKSAKRGIELAVSLLATTGTFADVIAIHLVPEWDNPGYMAKVSDIVELIAAACGVVTVSAAHVPVKGKVVALGAGAIDGILTVVSTTFGVIELTTSV